MIAKKTMFDKVFTKRALSFLAIFEDHLFENYGTLKTKQSVPATWSFHSTKIYATLIFGTQKCGPFLNTKCFLVANLVAKNA